MSEFPSSTDQCSNCGLNFQKSKKIRAEVKSLGVSTRAQNTLYGVMYFSGFEELSDLCRITKKDIAEWPACGVKTAKEIFDALEGRGVVISDS